MAGTRFDTIAAFIDRMVLPDENNEAALGFLARQPNNAAAIPVINQYPASFGLPQGDSALEEKDNTSGVNLVKAAQKKSIPYRISTLPNNSPHLAAIAKCRDPDAVKDYVNANTIIFGLQGGNPTTTGAPITAAELPADVIPHAQKIVVAEFLRGLAGDSPHLIAIANFTTPGDVRDYINGHKDVFGIDGGPHIDVGELSATVIADAQKKVLAVSISNLSDHDRLIALAQCHDLQAVLDEINNHKRDYGITNGPPITDIRLLPTIPGHANVIQFAQTQALSFILPSLRGDKFHAIVECKDNSEVAALLNADTHNEYGIYGGPPLTAAQIPRGVLADMQTRVREQALGGISHEAPVDIFKLPIYSRDASISGHGNLSLRIPDLEAKLDPGQPIPTSNLQEYVGGHLAHIQADHAAALNDLFASSSHPNHYLKSENITAFLATLYNPVMDAQDIDKEMRTKLGINLGPPYGDSPTNAGRTKPAIDQLILSIAKCNKEVRNAFKASFEKEVVLKDPLPGAAPLPPVKICAGVLKSEDEFNCLSKAAAGAGTALTHAFTAGTKKQDIAFAVMPKAPEHSRSNPKPTKGAGEPRSQQQSQAQDQDRAQAIITFFHVLQHDLDLTKPGKKRSPFCLRGTWNLTTLLQTMECCLANGKTFNLADAVSQLSIKNNTGDEILKFHKGQDLTQIVAEIDRLISNQSTSVRHTRSALATELLDLKKMIEDNHALSRPPIATANGSRETEVERTYRGILETRIVKLNNAHYNIDQLKTTTRSYDAFRTSAKRAGTIEEAQLYSGPEMPPPGPAPGRGPH